MLSYTAKDPVTAAIAESCTESWNLASKNGNLLLNAGHCGERVLRRKRNNYFLGGEHSWGVAYAADHPCVTSPIPSQKQLKRVKDGKASKNKNYKTCYFPPLKYGAKQFPNNLHQLIC